MADLLYKFDFTFWITEKVKERVSVTHSYSTEVCAFSVVGGVERHIWNDGRNDMGDADVMSEFYQARQFNNINILKLINRSTLEIDKVFYLKLPFDFTFVARSQSPSSRFRSLQLDAKKARIIEPPNRDFDNEALIIKFSNPKIFYIHDDAAAKEPTTVQEEI